MELTLLKHLKNIGWSFSKVVNLTQALQPKMRAVLSALMASNIDKAFKGEW